MLTRSPPAPQAAPPPGCDASSALAALRLAAGPAAGGDGGDGCAAFGHGRHLGLPVRWRLHASPDGSFFEEVASPQLAFCWGYDAVSARLWDVDQAGAGGELELDDRELVLLAAWARTGFWLRPAAASMLDIWLDDGSSADALADDADGDAAAALADAGADAPHAPSDVHLCLRLRAGGRLVARLRVCGATGRALSLRLRVAGDAEVWSFSGWAPDGGLPALTAHAAATGARDLYRADGARPAAPLPAVLYAPPPGALASLAGGAYEPGAPARVAVERARSGHTLVRIALNGKDAGLAILDTGASGLVISRAAADAAGMDAFGEVFVSGVGRKIASRFRRAASLRVGPLTLLQPLFLEMELRDLVWGASGPCIGIVGFDVFRRAVVDMPPPPATHVLLHDPREWTDAGAQRGDAAWRWVRCAMVANVPHCYARWHGAEGGGASPAELLMLDSGAGGADAVFHARSVARLRLNEVGAFAGNSSIRGVSGSGAAPAAAKLAPGGAHPTQRRQLDWLELLPGEPGAPSVRFRGVEALMLGTLGSFDLSEHMSGVVCMPLLARCRVVLDLLRKRIAFVAEPGEHDGLTKDGGDLMSRID